MKIIFDIPNNKLAAVSNFHRAAHIINLVCARFKVGARELECPSREWRHVWPRWIAIALIRQHTTLTTVQIGILFNRDHASIIHATKGVESECETNLESSRQFSSINNALRGPQNDPCRFNGMEQFSRFNPDTQR